MTVYLRHLTRGFSGRIVLDDISLDLAQGEFAALIGRSGSGKSTLLRAIAGLDDDAEGDGIVSVPENRSVLFQDSRLLPWLDVLSNVTLGLRLPNARERGRAALADVGLSGYEDVWPNVLSGGEQQRVALARSLVRQPELLLADEPFGALDALTRIRMHDLLFRLVTRHRPTVGLITHDVEEALILADRVLVIGEGSIILDHAVSLPYPRRKSDARFEWLRGKLLEALGITVQPVEAGCPGTNPAARLQTPIASTPDIKTNRALALGSMEPGSTPMK